MSRPLEKIEDEITVVGNTLARLRAERLQAIADAAPWKCGR